MEMVDDGGAVYLTTKHYEFPKDEKQLSTSFRKLMFLKPNEEQSKFNEEDSLETLGPDEADCAIGMVAKFGEE